MCIRDRKKAGELKKSLVREVLKHKKIALQVIGMTCGLTVAYYIWSVSTASVAQKNLGYSTNDAFGASIIGNLVFTVCLLYTSSSNSPAADAWPTLTCPPVTNG